MNKKKSKIMVGKEFKSELKEWKRSILVIEKIFPSVDGKEFVDVRDEITGNRYLISKDTLESSLYYEVSQSISATRDLVEYAEKEGQLVGNIANLNRAYMALSKICIADQTKVEQEIKGKIKELTALSKSMKGEWQVKIFQSYEKVV